MFCFCCDWILLNAAYKKNKNLASRERLFKKLDTQQSFEPAEVSWYFRPMIKMLKYFREVLNDHFWEYWMYWLLFVEFWLPVIWFFEQPCRKFSQLQSQNSNWNRLTLLNKGLQFQKGFDRFFRGNSRVISAVKHFPAVGYLDTMFLILEGELFIRKENTRHLN